MMAIIKLIRFLFKNLKQIIDYHIFILKFRKKNSHNKIFPANQFHLDKVAIGKYSYGTLHVESFCNCSEEKLVIGDFVSIAGNVTFILGGNHHTKTITTYPLKATITRKDFQIDASSKGPIVIEDDVWIGYGAIVLSGVTIRRGAIIAAGAVVTKDIPPYAIAGGNPAKIIKYRFNEEVINELQHLSIADFDETSIIENIEEFYKPLDLPQINKLKEIKQKNKDR